VGVLLFLALALTACSKDGEEVQPGEGTAVTGEVGEDPQPQPGAGYGAPEKDISGGVSGEAVSGDVVPQDDFRRKIVKTANLGISSDDVRGEAARAQQVGARFGGTILSSQTYHVDNATYADLVISVLSEQFEDALVGLRRLGEEVTTDTVVGQDVTEEYVDLQSRERNLLAAGQTLLDLYNRAHDVQNALSI
jgi:hypothetical protein